MSKDWWKRFFTADIGKVLFSMPEEQSIREVQSIIRETGIEKGARVLDLCCGTGRHSIEFARLGMEVIGLDYSKDYVECAREKARCYHLADRVTVLRGDMRNIVRYLGAGSVDLVVLLFNSFGYFQDKREDAKALREIATVLRPGGKVVIETLNPLAGSTNRALSTPVPSKKRVLGVAHEPVHRLFVMHNSSFDQSSSRIYFSWTIVDARKAPAKVSRVGFYQNIYSIADFEHMLTCVGMKIVKSWGTNTSEMFDPHKSWHYSFVAIKDERSSLSPNHAGS